MPQSPPAATRWLTTKQVAARFGTSPSTVLRMVDSGRLPGAINIGRGTQRRRGLRIPESAVIALETTTEESAASAA